MGMAISGQHYEQRALHCKLHAQWAALLLPPCTELWSQLEIATG